jgi:Reverse transcriptase (RNA-dependent DNA polymerase)
MDWLTDLDLRVALKNCRNDMLGDWYRDPWGWPEVEWAVSQRPEIITARLNSTGARRAAKLDVAKENFGIRPAVVLDPIDRLIYQALVDNISRKIVGAMPTWVYGWRLPPSPKKSGTYARNDLQWLKLIADLKRNARRYSFLLKTDIVSFFASIPINHLVEQIFDSGRRTAPTERLTEMLHAWDKTPDRGGLPQRSSASAVLANLYLQPVDDLIGHYFKRSVSRHSGTAVRWMDDIWIFGEDESDLRALQIETEHALRGIGLDLNLAKTAVFRGPEVMHEIARLDFTGLDYGLGIEPPAPQSLRDFETLKDQVLSSPEQANRTTVRFITTRMRRYSIYKDLPRFVRDAPRMPHCADFLARLFRDSGESRNMIDWYLDYAVGPWGRIDWTLAQLGTMFSAQVAKSLSLEEYFSDLLAKNRSLALTALASQRLASSEGTNARFILRETAASSDSPMQKRVLALASLQASESRPVVRRILSEFEENAVTLEMLEERGFRPPKPVSDYLGERRLPT